MTKTEQLWVTTWRSKVLQHATAIGNVANVPIVARTFNTVAILERAAPAPTVQRP